MNEILAKLHDLNIAYFEDETEIQCMDQRSWEVARKRLGHAYYVTPTTAVYEYWGIRITLVQPQGEEANDSRDT